ncbi:MAG: DUF4271 domain-containing protein [Prevotella sp.]|nr:DUF4271 domain-containing protein [Prevotella sp.]
MSDSTYIVQPVRQKLNLMKGFDPKHVTFIRNDTDTIRLSLTQKSDGLLGEDVPYSVSSDNTVTALLLGCFLLGMLALSVSRQFMVRQIHNFFYVPRSVADMTETDYEINVQTFLVLQTALTIGILYYLLSRFALGNDYSQMSQLKVIGIFSLILVGYFAVKKLAYHIVGWTFFSAKNNDQWSKAWLFLTAAEGVLLYPILLVQIYFGLPLQIAGIWAALIIILVKLLSLYKCYAIFFKHGGGIVQNILYFCALELMPLLALVGILQITGNYLKVNF